jgi:hypothetical protein
LLIGTSMRFCLITSIFAYTPFLKSEIAIRVLYKIGELVGKWSLKKGRNIVRYAETLRADLLWSKEAGHQLIYSRIIVFVNPL